jgi:type I restriction-modification system DNA methylase subunit
MDASEYNEFIFGMLLLKRLSDQFETEQEKLKKKYEKQGMKPALITRQLANPDTLADVLKNINFNFNDLGQRPQKSDGCIVGYKFNLRGEKL